MAQKSFPKVPLSRLPSLLFMLLVLVVACNKSNPDLSQSTVPAIEQAFTETATAIVQTETVTKVIVALPTSTNIPTDTPTIEATSLPSPTVTITVTTIPVVQLETTPTCILSTNGNRFRGVSQIEEAGESITRVAARNDQLFVIDRQEEVFTWFDATDHYKPKIVQQIDLQSYQRDVWVTVTDSYLYIYGWVHDQFGLQIFSVENLSNVEMIRGFNRAELGNSVGGILQTDNHAYVVVRGSVDIQYLDLQTFELSEVVITLDTNGYAESYIDPVVETDHYIFALNVLSESFKSPQASLVIYEKKSLTDLQVVSIQEMPDFDYNANHIETKDSLITWIESDKWSSTVPDELLAFDTSYSPEQLENESSISSALQSAISDWAILDTIVYVVTQGGELFIIETDPNC
jgi:hypothetical protein